ncbi:MAG: hypothetical protein AAF581_04060 [Planctomycetota bacterium]
MYGLALQAVLLIATVGFFYTAAESEGESTLLWAGISVGLWCVSIWVLGWGLLGGLLLQLGLFVTLTMRNMLRQ